MKITELLEISAIAPNLGGRRKVEVLGELVDTLRIVHPQLDREEVLQVLLEREQLGSTGIGEGVAIPHGKLRGIDRLLIAFGRHSGGVDFDSMDGRPAHLFFLLLAPESEVTAHLKALARISKMLRKDGVRQRLMAATDAAGLLEIVAQEEALL